MNLEIALSIIGSLSEPSKMPCYSWSISPKYCHTGAKLRLVKGSICSVCYGFRGHYPFPAVKTAQEKRYQGINHPLWSEAMALAINTKDTSGFFRWFDTGDLQGVEHLDKIVKVCQLTPEIQHWLPTREYGYVTEWFKKNGAFPANLTVRLSAHMIEGAAPTEIANKVGAVTAGVAKTGFTCPSSSQGNKCLRCRACWDKSVANVSYKKH